MKRHLAPPEVHFIAHKSVISLHARHATTQEVFINGITNVDGVGGDKRRQPALLRLALDDVVLIHLHFILFRLG